MHCTCTCMALILLNVGLFIRLVALLYIPGCRLSQLVAQLVEYLPRMQYVVGLNHTQGSFFLKKEKAVLHVQYACKFCYMYNIHGLCIFTVHSS